MAVFHLLTSLVFVTLCASYGTNYNGHQLWRVENIPRKDAGKIQQLIDNFQLDVWASGHSWVDIQVIPERQVSFRDHLKEEGFSYKVQIYDLQRLIEMEQKTLKSTKESVGIDISNYHQLSEIEAYMVELAASFSWVSLEPIGKTVEGREMWVSILSVPGDTQKPTIWMDCGIHAKEWISPATCVYGLNYLTNGYSTIDDVTQLLDKYDIYILPVHNPDGYSFSWTDDRLWRKNRREPPQEEGCYGVDLNRNYDDGHWGGIGSTNHSCLPIYRGVSGFSEPESQNVRNYTTKLINNNNLTAYFSIHSYGQLWMHAYGWSPDDPPENDQLERVSKTGVDALAAVHNTTFKYGTHWHTIYPATGTSMDWGYSTGVVHTYILELRDKGDYGFLLPSDQIISTGEETWDGIIAAVMAI